MVCAYVTRYHYAIIKHHAIPLPLLTSDNGEGGKKEDMLMLTVLSSSPRFLPKLALEKDTYCSHRVGAKPPQTLPEDNGEDTVDLIMEEACQHLISPFCQAQTLLDLYQRVFNVGDDISGVNGRFYFHPNHTDQAKFGEAHFLLEVESRGVALLAEVLDLLVGRHHIKEGV